MAEGINIVFITAAVIFFTVLIVARLKKRIKGRPVEDFSPLSHRQSRAYTQVINRFEWYLRENDPVRKKEKADKLLAFIDEFNQHFPGGKFKNDFNRIIKHINTDLR